MTSGVAANADGGSGPVRVGHAFNQSILTITPTGTASTLAVAVAVAVAVASDGTPDLADPFNNAIRKGLPDGTASAPAGQAAAASGALSVASFALPAGMALGADGSLFVADSAKHLMRRID